MERIKKHHMRKKYFCVRRFFGDLYQNDKISKDYTGDNDITDAFSVKNLGYRFNVSPTWVS